MAGFDMKPPLGGIRGNTPSDDILIDLGDGHGGRPLRYTFRTLKVLKGLGLENHLSWTPETLPIMIFAGLHDPDGNPPEGVTLQDLQNAPLSWTSYLGGAFNAAYRRGMPEDPPKGKTTKNVESLESISTESGQLQ